MKLVSDAYFEYYDGPTGPRGSSRKEHLEVIDAVSHTRYHYPNVIIFHVPNEGAIPPQYRDKLLQMGLLGGVSDLVLLKPSKGYHGAMIEMKRTNKSDSTVSQDQIDFLRWAREEGYFTAVCFGAEEYIKCLRYYLA